MERKEKHARIYFTQGRVAYAHMRSGAHLGEVLVRMDLVTALEVQEILMTQRRESPGTLLGRMAVERGILTEDDLARAIERQAFDVVGEVLTWSDGAFEFHDVDANASQVPFGHGVDALVLLMRVIQSTEEVREVSVPRGRLLALRRPDQGGPAARRVGSTGPGRLQELRQGDSGRAGHG